MKLLITAGNTVVPIDRVRQITNVATGRTGAAIARHAYERGHTVTLVTSRPEAGAPHPPARASRWRLVTYQTFDELMAAMQQEIREDPPDALIHSAAVNDYRVVGVYAPAPGTRAREDAAGLTWAGDGAPAMIDVAAGKVKSSFPEIWLRLLPTPKNTSVMRSEWGFRGVLVLFKLEADGDEAGLIASAEALRERSGADLMVANLLETAGEWAYLGPAPEGYRRVPRAELPARLLAAVEARGARREEIPGHETGN